MGDCWDRQNLQCRQKMGCVKRRFERDPFFNKVKATHGIKWKQFSMFYGQDSMVAKELFEGYFGNARCYGCHSIRLGDVEAFHKAYRDATEDDNFNLKYLQSAAGFENILDFWKPPPPTGPKPSTTTRKGKEASPKPTHSNRPKTPAAREPKRPPQNDPTRSASTGKGKETSPKPAPQRRPNTPAARKSKPHPASDPKPSSASTSRNAPANPQGSFQSIKSMEDAWNRMKPRPSYSGFANSGSGTGSGNSSNAGSSKGSPNNSRTPSPTPQPLHQSAMFGATADKAWTSTLDKQIASNNSRTPSPKPLHQGAIPVAMGDKAWAVSLDKLTAEWEAVTTHSTGTNSRSSYRY